MYLYESEIYTNPSVRRITGGVNNVWRFLNFIHFFRLSRTSILYFFLFCLLDDIHIYFLNFLAVAILIILIFHDSATLV